MHITEILLGKVWGTFIEDTLRVISVIWNYFCAFGTICTTALGFPIRDPRVSLLKIGFLNFAFRNLSKLNSDKIPVWHGRAWLESSKEGGRGALCVSRARVGVFLCYRVLPHFGNLRVALEFQCLS